jgi:hypothetical protein
MIFWWLGRRGFGASGSSESFRGSLTVSVMVFSLDGKIRRTNPKSSTKLLFLLEYFANLMLLSQPKEPAATYLV